jgi:hypothetical protein
MWPNVKNANGQRDVRLILNDNWGKFWQQNVMIQRKKDTAKASGAGLRTNR